MHFMLKGFLNYKTKMKGMHSFKDESYSLHVLTKLNNESSAYVCQSAPNSLNSSKHNKTNGYVFDTNTVLLETERHYNIQIYLHICICTYMHNIPRFDIYILFEMNVIMSTNITRKKNFSIEHRNISITTTENTEKLCNSVWSRNPCVVAKRVKAQSNTNTHYVHSFKDKMGNRKKK